MALAYLASTKAATQRSSGDLGRRKERADLLSIADRAAVEIESIGVDAWLAHTLAPSAGCTVRRAAMLQRMYPWPAMTLGRRTLDLSIFSHVGPTA
jgi:hypothetical protein